MVALTSSTTKPSQCQYPYFKKIVEDCKKKMLRKYPEYKNSWQGFIDFEFWEKRLLTEVREFIDAIKYGETSFEHQRLEGIDIINVVSMILENIPEINAFYGRKPTDAVYPNWRYS